LQYSSDVSAFLPPPFIFEHDAFADIAFAGATGGRDDRWSPLRMICARLLIWERDDRWSPLRMICARPLIWEWDDRWSPLRMICARPLIWERDDRWSPLRIADAISFRRFLWREQTAGNLPYIVSGRFLCALSCRRFCRASGSRAFAYGGGCLFLLFCCQASKEDLKAHLAVNPQKNCCLRFDSGRDQAYPYGAEGAVRTVHAHPCRQSRHGGIP